MEVQKNNRSVKIFGVRLDQVSFDEAYNRFVLFMSSEELKTIFTPNTEMIMKAQDDKEFKSILSSGDLVIPDGIGVVLASKLHNLGLTERVTGIELMGRMLEYCNRSGKSIYLFGGKPGIAKSAASKILETFPNIEIKGCSDGYYDKSQELKILDTINEKKPDILFVALGAPKQEKWIYTHRKIINAKVAMGVGGALDIWAGTAKRAPMFYQKTGLEWFYRLMSQPTRLFRMMSLPKFVIKVIFSKSLDD